eukprot:143533-Pleurochrysis_carterae.AAC.1
MPEKEQPFAKEHVPQTLNVHVPLQLSARLASAFFQRLSSSAPLALATHFQASRRARAPPSVLRNLARSRRHNIHLATAILTAPRKAMVASMGHYHAKDQVRSALLSPTMDTSQGGCCGHGCFHRHGHVAQSPGADSASHPSRPAATVCGGRS